MELNPPFCSPIYEMVDQPYSITAPDVLSPSPTLKPSLGFRIGEARLRVNVAKFGEMKPYAIITYGSQSCKTSVSTGMKPIWNSYYEFSSAQSDSIEIALFHKAMLIGDVEIGKVVINLNQVVNSQPEWWELTSATREICGTILLSFDFGSPVLHTESSLVISAHSPTSSTELREESTRRRNFDFEGEEALMQKLKMKKERLDKRRRDYQGSGLTFQTEEQQHIDQMRKDMEDERLRISKQDAKVRKLFFRLDQESDSIKKDKEHLRHMKEDILQREEAIIAAKETTESDRRKLAEEKMKFEELKSALNLGYAKLKQDKLKLKAKKKLFESASQKIDGASRKLEKQKQEIQRQIQDSREQENSSQQEWDEIDDLRNQLKEKERMIELQFEALAKDKAALERERGEVQRLKSMQEVSEHDIAEEETDKRPISVMVISDQVKHRVISSDSSHLRLILSPGKSGST